MKDELIQVGRTAAAMSDVRDGFAIELARLARWWRARLDEKLRPTGLTQAKWVALFHLLHGGDGINQKDLAIHIGIEAPTLVRLLDSLEERGLIERQPDTTDRRAKTIHLTDAGALVLADLQDLAKELRIELLAGVSDSDLRACIRVFDTIMAPDPTTGFVLTNASKNHKSNKNDR